MLGKARVAHLKALFIPKIEFQGALLATRLKEEVLKCLTFKVTAIFILNHSTTVFSGLTLAINYPILRVFTLVRFWNLQPLISAIIY